MSASWERTEATHLHVADHADRARAFVRAVNQLSQVASWSGLCLGHASALSGACWLSLCEHNKWVVESYAWPCTLLVKPVSRPRSSHLANHVVGREKSSAEKNPPPVSLDRVCWATEHQNKMGPDPIINWFGHMGSGSQTDPIWHYSNNTDLSKQRA